MPRGGRRQGVPGANYANRSDLALGPRKLPVTTAPNQTYGEAGAQEQAQQAVPMGNAPLPTAQGTDLAGVMQSAQQFNPPAVPQMGDPSMRPGEPVTTGINTQPSAPLAAGPVLKGVALLNALGEQVSPEVKALRNVLTASQANQAAP